MFIVNIGGVIMSFDMETVRFYLGLFFIIYGIVFVAIEKFKGITIYDAKDQINGIINGSVCMLVGVVVFSTSLKMGIITSVVVLLIWIIERGMLKAYLNTKKAKYLNHTGVSTSSIKARHKGKAIIDGKEVKITAWENDIPKDSEIIITDLVGATLLAKNK